MTPEEIIGEVKAGLYVTELMGFGVNTVTGDYSRGATGLWIENGAADARGGGSDDCGESGRDADAMLTAIGNDLVFRGAVASPTLRIDGMTIAGA